MTTQTQTAHALICAHNGAKVTDLSHPAEDGSLKTVILKLDVTTVAQDTGEEYQWHSDTFQADVSISKKSGYLEVITLNATPLASPVAAKPAVDALFEDGEETPMPKKAAKKASKKAVSSDLFDDEPAAEKPQEEPLATLSEEALEAAFEPLVEAAAALTKPEPKVVTIQEVLAGEVPGVSATVTVEVVPEPEVKQPKAPKAKKPTKVAAESTVETKATPEPEKPENATVVEDDLTSQAYTDKDTGDLPQGWHLYQMVDGFMVENPKGVRVHHRNGSIKLYPSVRAAVNAAKKRAK